MSERERESERVRERAQVLLNKQKLSSELERYKQSSFLPSEQERMRRVRE